MKDCIMGVHKNQVSADKSSQIKAGNLAINHRELARLNPPAKWDSSHEIFIFRRHGDSLVCLLYPSIGLSERTQRLYPAETLEHKRVLLHGNKHLQRLIRRHDLIGKWVKIVYKQDAWGRNRHKLKIYEVYDYTEKVKRGGMSAAAASAVSEAMNKRTG